MCHQLVCHCVYPFSMRMSSVGLCTETVNNNNNSALNSICTVYTAQQAQHSHLSFVSVGTIPSLLTVAMPLLTRPNMVCFPVISEHNRVHKRTTIQLHTHTNNTFTKSYK